MKTLVLAALLAAASAHAAERGPDAAQCLDPNKPLAWEALGDQALVVSSLGRYYVIGLEQKCDLLPYARTIGFVGTGLSRICGRFGEAVRVKGTKCRIAKLERVAKAQYDELLAAKQAAKQAAKAAASGR